MMNNPYSAYKNNTVLTASPQELTLMLYEGAIKFCNLGIKGIENKDITKAHNNIMKVQNILEELQATLNHKYEVSENFSKMYDYMYQRLLEANTKKDPEILKEVHGYFQEFRNTWKQVMKLSKQQKSSNLG